MSKKRIILAAAIALVVSGAALAGYPLYLKAQTYLEQRRLEQAFKAYTSLDPSKYEPLLPRDWEVYQPLVLPKWEEFPPTRLEIPAIKMKTQVVAVKDMGIFEQELSQIPSYFPHSAFPGEVGNVCIAGHRGGSAGYFRHLEDLEAGDTIFLHAPGISYNYTVEKVFVVEPTEVQVVGPLDYPGMTLVTCKRVGNNYSAKRTIVRAKFQDAVFSQGE